MHSFSRFVLSFIVLIALISSSGCAHTYSSLEAKPDASDYISTPVMIELLNPNPNILSMEARGTMYDPTNLSARKPFNIICRVNKDRVICHLPLHGFYAEWSFTAQLANGDLEKVCQVPLATVSDVKGPAAIAHKDRLLHRQLPVSMEIVRAGECSYSFAEYTISPTKQKNKTLASR